MLRAGALHADDNVSADRMAGSTPCLFSLLSALILLDSKVACAGEWESGARCRPKAGGEAQARVDRESKETREAPDFARLEGSATRVALS